MSSLDAWAYFGMKQRTISSKCVGCNVATDMWGTLNHPKCEIQVKG